MKTTILPVLAAVCALTFAGAAYAQHGHGQQPHAPKAPATHGQGRGGKTHGGSATGHGAGGPHTTAKAPKASTHGPSAHPTGTAGAPLTPVQQKLLRNTNLATKVQSQLPAGMTVQDASLGFRNLGQFVAAVNVSNNLGIPFAELKSRMTGANPMSLGQAIHTLRPTVDAKAESRTAQRQAEAMIAGKR